MRKVFIVLILSLFGIGIILSLLDYNGAYSAERYMWRVNRQFTKLSKDTQNIPDKKYQEIADKYLRFMKKYPNSNLRPNAHIYMGKIEILRGNYEEGRRILKEIPEHYPNDYKSAELAYNEIAESYEKEGDIQNALGTYHKIKEDYPLTDLGLRVPLIIAVLHADNNDIEWSEKVFEDAIEYYKVLGAKYQNSIIEYKTLHLLVRCYMAKNDWNNAMNVLQKVLNDYSDPKYLDTNKAVNLIRGINSLGIGKMKDYKLVIKIYSDFIIDHPKHPINSILERLIDSTNQIMNANAQVN